MNDREYERIVKEIYETLGKADGVTIECWGASCKVQGRTVDEQGRKQEYQIDVLTTHNAGLHQYRTAIECKYWNKKVGRDPIMKLAEIIEDAGIDKGVVVSKMGFTGPAKSYAESKNIGLVELRKPVDKDWERYIKTIPIEIYMQMPPDVSLEIVVPRNDDSEKLSTLMPMHLPLERMLVESLNRKTKTLHKIVNDGVFAHPTESEFEIQFETGSVVLSPDHQVKCPISSVRFKVKHRIHTETFEIHADNYVYMITEAIFEGRRFTIAPDGKIWEESPDDGQ